MENYITAKEAAELLNCSRGHVERLHLKGELNPVPTIYPKYYFDKNEVNKLKGKIRGYGKFRKNK